MDYRFLYRSGSLVCLRENVWSVMEFRGTHRLEDVRPPNIQQLHFAGPHRDGGSLHHCWSMVVPATVSQETHEVASSSRIHLHLHHTTKCGHGIRSSTAQRVWILGQGRIWFTRGNLVYNDVLRIPTGQTKKDLCTSSLDDSQLRGFHRCFICSLFDHSARRLDAPGMVPVCDLVVLGTKLNRRRNLFADFG